VRKASFTEAESGKTSATSGDKRIRFAPAAYRAAYLPRTPPEKSMSGTLLGGADLAFFLCILSSLTYVGTPGTEDARHLSAIRVANDQKPTAIRHAEKIVSQLG